MIVTRGSLDTNLLWLGEPACHDRALVGGKAAHLSRLAASQRVPPGFCLTAAALDRALAGNLALDEGSTGLPSLPRALYHGLVTAYQAADLYLLQCRPITTPPPSTAKRSG